MTREEKLKLIKEGLDNLAYRGLDYIRERSLEDICSGMNIEVKPASFYVFERLGDYIGDSQNDNLADIVDVNDIPEYNLDDILNVMKEEFLIEYEEELEEE